MTPEIQWDYGSKIFLPPSSTDCEHAAWAFKFWNSNSIAMYPFWGTLRDMMLHGY